jgi:hypothetical protein
MQRMRILLQQEGTALYFQKMGAWTSEPMSAMDFLSSTAAIEYCLHHKVTGVQIVLKFADQKHDIVLPMRRDGYHKATRQRDLQ